MLWDQLPGATTSEMITFELNLPLTKYSVLFLTLTVFLGTNPSNYEAQQHHIELEIVDSYSVQFFQLPFDLLVP